MSFEVNDLKSATWAIGKIRESDLRIKEKEEVARAEIDKIKEWLEAEKEKEEKESNYLRQLVSNYYIEEKTKDKKFKLSTPYGKVSSRKQQPKMLVDDNAALEYLERNNADKVKTIMTYDKRDLKKLFSVVETNDGLKAVDENGEFLDFINLSKQPDNITIKTEE